MATIRLALAQMNAVVGGLSENVGTIRRLSRQANALGADLIITPELALTGYPPEDLLLKQGFVDAAARSINELAHENENAVLVLGTVLDDSNPLVHLGASHDGRGGPGLSAFPRISNALAVISDGQIGAVATKRYLPNYDVFDEQRYFLPGTGPLTLLNVQGVAVGLLICEDVWIANGPAAELANQGASLLLVANASPYARGFPHEREAMLVERARETGCTIAYVNMVGGQDEIVFDGQSVVINNEGDVLARAVAFDEQLLIVDIDVEGSDRGELLLVTPSPKPAVPVIVAEPLPLLDEVYRALVTGTRDYLRKNGFRSAVIALSGGIDSSLVAVIAADAIGPAAVHGYAMPSRYSSDHSISDALELAKRLDIEITTVPIEPAHEAFGALLREATDSPIEGLPDENLQSRIRGVLLMGISNATGSIVLTTGNKSEMATGYSTLYGDSAGGFAVIKDVPKTLVFALCRYRNERALDDGDTPPIPDAVLTKAPSAELRPDQRDDQSLPTYELLDPLLELYVEGDATDAQLIRDGYDPALVATITRLVDLSEYKRRQMPPGVRISKKAFGRDRRMPITNAFRSEKL